MSYGEGWCHGWYSKLTRVLSVGYDKSRLKRSSVPILDLGGRRDAVKAHIRTQRFGDED